VGIGNYRFENIGFMPRISASIEHGGKDPLLQRDQKTCEMPSGESNFAGASRIRDAICS
jgi:hypothetical protein